LEQCENKGKNGKSDKDNSQKYSLKKCISKGKKAERRGRKWFRES